MVILKKAIDIDPFCAEYIKNPSEDIQFYSVSKNGNTIQYFESFCEEYIKEAAIKQEPLSIGFITDPSENLKELAIKLNPSAKQWIENK